MTITLTSAQKAKLEALVASGKLPSVEAGVNAALADFMTLSEDDLAWARPYADEARRSIAEGRASQGEEIIARLDERIARLNKI